MDSSSSKKRFYQFKHLFHHLVDVAVQPLLMITKTNNTQMYQHNWNELSKIQFKRIIRLVA